MAQKYSQRMKPKRQKNGGRKMNFLLIFLPPFFCHTLMPITSPIWVRPANQEEFAQIDLSGHAPCLLPSFFCHKLETLLERNSEQGQALGFEFLPVPGEVAVVGLG